MVDSTAESALAAHYRAAVGGGDDPQVLVAGAKLFVDKGRLDVAEHLYRRALARDPHNYWASMGLARVCELDERFDDAVALYKEALDAAQGRSQETYARTGLATALTGAGQLAQAEELFEHIIEEVPDYVYAYTGLVFLYETFPAPPWEKIANLCERAVSLAPAEASWINPKLVNAQARLAYLSRRVGDSGANDLEVAQSRQDQDALEFAVLFRRRKLTAILESQLRDHPLPYTLLIRQLFERVEAVGPGRFSSLPEFLLFAADFLAGGQDASATGKQNVDLPLAKQFYELSLDGKGSGLAAAHAGLLKLYLRLDLFDGAEAAVVRAVAEAGDDPAIVGSAAQLMQAMGRPAEARLLAGRVLELAPAPAAVAVAKGDVTDPVGHASQVWLNLQLIHDTANNAKVGKFGGVDEWLAAMNLKSGARKRALTKNFAKIDLMTGWLGEFLSLLGGYSPALLLDLEHYRQHAGIWFKDLDDALLHYFEIGWRDRISTHAAVDNGYVRRQLQEHHIDSSSEPPLLLFLRHEKALALSPNVLFDPAMYVKALTEIPPHPWFHYLDGGWQQNPNVSPWFDMERFCNGVRRSPQDTLLSPLMFYFARGRLLDVNGLFHAEFYDSRYRESVGDSAPLAHYLSEGVFLGYQPNPFFQPQGMTVQQRLTYLKIKSVV